MKHGILSIAVLFLLGFMAPVYAGDPYSAYYSADNGKLFWFIQITDIHIGDSGSQDTENLAWIVNEAKDVIAPEFIVASGDLTDSTNGGIIPNGPYPQEWQDYLGILSDADGIEENYYYDFPGNHDHYNDPNFSFYLNNSIQGPVTGNTQVAWRRDFSFGSYHFIGVCTAGNDGASFSLSSADNFGDHAGLDPLELDFIESQLQSNPDADLTIIFGHHPLPLRPTGNQFDTYLTYGDQEFMDFMETYGVSLYAYGHTHQYRKGLLLSSENTTGILDLNVASLGESSGGPYQLIAIDCNGISTVQLNAGVWPAVLITAPMDIKFGTVENPYAYSLGCSNPKPIRALVFDENVISRVEYRIDSTGNWKEMTSVPGNPYLWEAFWDASELDEGEHTLEVQAMGSTTRSHRITIRSTTADCRELSRAIAILQILCGISPTVPITMEEDVNDDGKLGLEEVVYSLQKISDLR